MIKPEYVWQEEVPITLFPTALRILSYPDFTGLDGEKYSAEVNKFLTKLKGKKVLSIGLGITDLSVHLRQRGISAHAFDCEYQSIGRIIGQSRRWLKQTVQDFASEGEYIATMRRFVDDFELHNHYYHTAASLKLPFMDNEFDLVIAHLSNQEAAVPTLDEVFRVLALEGKASIYPIDNNEKTRQTLKHFKAQGAKISVHNLPTSDLRQNMRARNLLQIVKSGEI